MECKLTAAAEEAILKAIRSGAYIETAAALAGVGRSTFYDWLKKGRDQKTGKYRTFVDRVEQAIAAAEVDALAIINKAAERNWCAAAWRLERRHPNRWGRVNRKDQEAEANASVNLSVTFKRAKGVTLEQERARRKRAKK